MFTCLANGLWFLTALPESLAFHRGLSRVAATQQQYLLRLLQRNAETEFGRRYDFSSIRSVAEYQARVPLSTYDDYQAAIRQIGDGQEWVLTHDPVLLLEPTSGSTAATKYIPYTAALKVEFQRAIAPWIVDLFRRDPRQLFGQAYWSVSPIVKRNQPTPGGIPIGFEADSEYFGRLQHYFIQAIQAVPAHVRLIDRMAAFRYVTLLFLLRSRALTLISVWNPTFLTLLVEPLTEWWPRLTTDIARGTLSPPSHLATDLHAALRAMNQPHPRRAAEIRTIFQTYTDPGELHTRLWPHLRLISCWSDAQAALYVAELARLFPHAQLQGKGLLATEGVLSFPLIEQTGPVLALRSHFFEFLPVTGEAQWPQHHPAGSSRTGSPASPTTLLAHELEVGSHYEVILTTGGGLYRYQLHDVVEVVGHLKNCPLFRFVGKIAYVSDHFGEKLNERHVRQALKTLFKRHGLHPTFAMLACEISLKPPAYVCFIELKDVSDEVLAQLGLDLETTLQENFHYRYCRDLGQLGPLGVFHIDKGAMAAYLTTCQAHGQRAGDIKPVALHRLGGWLEVFRGKMTTSIPNHFTIFEVNHNPER